MSVGKKKSGQLEVYFFFFKLKICQLPDPIDPAGNSRSAPPSRGPPPSYGGSSRYDDYGSSSRDGYGSRDSYPSSRSEPYPPSRGERSMGRPERGPPPPVERGYPPRDSYAGSSRGAPRGARGGPRVDRGMARSRYWTRGQSE